MGGEGANWIGEAPFSNRNHVFQNIGDGTYNHSGYMAIRAAIASGVNVTYKILFNDAVAMTGGQRNDGGLTVDQIARQVAAEGAKKVVVVTDEPWKYPANTGWPAGTTIYSGISAISPRTSQSTRGPPNSRSGSGARAAWNLRWASPAPSDGWTSAARRRKRSRAKSSPNPHGSSRDGR